MLFLCLKIFFVRILDVSLGTVRTMFTVKGNRITASLVGFIEILVWFLVAKEALQTEEKSILIAISYSLGFATGTYIGGYLSSVLITGNITVQVFTDNLKLEQILRKKGYAVSVIECKGYNENKGKHMLYININKKKEQELMKIVNINDEHAFVVVNETKYVENGYFK
ncbi:uPF0316 protein Amet_0954 [Clostridium sp. CAG:1193]|jgi:uncharacterized protein YebE (UPF0316 family)|nr:uPF0316 protein Amet_0954 [Clostridium sp. CAG:1193]